MKRRKKSKVQVKFSPYEPLYFVVYTDGSDESAVKIAEIKRFLLPYRIEVKVKPITVNSPTRLPAVFVQDRYFFSLLSQVRGEDLLSFVLQAQDHVRRLNQQFYERNKGKYVVLQRPIYDKDANDYINKYHILSPSGVQLGFLSFESNKVGFPVTQWLIESLQRMGVDVLVYADSHTISSFRFYVGKIQTGED